MALFMLANHLLSPEYFHALRTEQQLGYLVANKTDALTSTQVAALSTGQVASLTSVQINALASDDLKALTTALNKRVEFALADALGRVDASVAPFGERFPELASHADPAHALLKTTEQRELRQRYQPLIA